MFRIDTPTRNEVVNLATVMNLLHMSEKKACAILDSIDRDTACAPMSENLDC